jgi:transposase-like protein
MGISGVPLDKMEIIRELHKSGGRIKNAAKAMGCTPEAIYQWVAKDQSVKIALEEAREETKARLRDCEPDLLKLAYESANNLLVEQDTTMTIFTLKALAKWRDRHEELNMGAQPAIIKTPTMEPKIDNPSE